MNDFLQLPGKVKVELNDRATLAAKPVGGNLTPTFLTIHSKVLFDDFPDGGVGDALTP